MNRERPTWPLRLAGEEALHEGATFWVRHGDQVEPQPDARLALTPSGEWGLRSGEQVFSLWSCYASEEMALLALRHDLEREALRLEHRLREIRRRRAEIRDREYLGLHSDPFGGPSDTDVPATLPVTGSGNVAAAEVAGEPYVGGPFCSPPRGVAVIDDDGDPA